MVCTQYVSWCRIQVESTILRPKSIDERWKRQLKHELARFSAVVFLDWFPKESLTVKVSGRRRREALRRSERSSSLARPYASWGRFIKSKTFISNRENIEVYVIDRNWNFRFQINEPDSAFERWSESGWKLSILELRSNAGVRTTAKTFARSNVYTFDDSFHRASRKWSKQTQSRERVCTLYSTTLHDCSTRRQ